MPVQKSRYQTAYTGRGPSASMQYAASAACAAQISVATGMRTSQITHAFARLKDSVVQRGLMYANNPAASRGGYMAENFIADSYNLDAVLKNIDTPFATVPAKNELGSADIIYGNKSASVKFYTDAKSSMKAQMNPEYEDQTRLLPSDQLEEAKRSAEEMARKNEMKGRTDVAKQQRKTADKLSDRIRSENGVESTPLTKEQDMKLARSIKRDEKGNVSVDEKMIDEVFEETGITGRVKKTKFRNEMRGLGMAAAIGMGVGFTMSLLAELARIGLESDQIGTAVSDSIAAGAEAGLLAGATHLAGRGMTLLIEKTGIDITSEAGMMLNSAAIGLLSTAIVCVYQFVRGRNAGQSREEAWEAVGKTALSSVSMLAVSMIAQGLWGGAAGIIVSTGIGLLYYSVELGKTVHARRLECRIREYTIEEYRAAVEEKNCIYIT